MQIPGLNLLNNSIEKEFTHPYGQITQDSTATGDHVADSVSASIEGTDAPQPSAVEIYDSSLINDENLRDSTATSALKDLAVDPLELALAAAASREIQSRFHESSATVLNITEEHLSEDVSSESESADSNSSDGAEGIAEDEPLGDGWTIKTKNEIESDVGPVHLDDILIPADAPIEKLGSVEKLMGSIAIVRAHMNGEYRILDEGGIVVTEARSPIGTISETFGPVKAPRYIVRLAEQLLGLSLGLDTVLYYARDRASFIFTQTLRGIKGSDASNIYDEEVNDDEREFSDDEAEMEHRKILKRKQRQERGDNHASRTEERSTSHNTRPPAASNFGPTYTPLSRPRTMPPEFRPIRRNFSDVSDHDSHRKPYGVGQNSALQAVNTRHTVRNKSNPATSNSSPHDINSGMATSYNCPQPWTQFSENKPTLNQHSAIPAGAYINPAFFPRLNTPSTQALNSLQQQLDILRGATDPPTQGGR